MTVFLLSLTGIPPLAGFFAKALVVLGALEVGGGTTLLAVVLMLNAAAAAFYYLRVVVVMYMRKPAEDAGPVSIGLPTRVGLVLAATAHHRHRPVAARHGGRAGLDGGRGRRAHLDLGRTPGPAHLALATSPRKRAASRGEDSTWSARSATPARVST